MLKSVVLHSYISNFRSTELGTEIHLYSEELSFTRQTPFRFSGAETCVKCTIHTMLSQWNYFLPHSCGCWLQHSEEGELPNLCQCEIHLLAMGSSFSTDITIRAAMTTQIQFIPAQQPHKGWEQPYQQTCFSPQDTSLQGMFRLAGQE